MDFAVIGTLSSYVKRQNLSFAAKHKLRTGQTLTNANGNFVSVKTSTFDKLVQASKTTNDQVKRQKLARIKQKLHDGQKLSDEELGFLRTNDPKTYRKAKHADEAREELKAELKRAKSKSDAREAMTRAMVKASAEAMAELSALGQGGGGGAVAGGAVNSGGEVSAEGGEVSTADAGAEISTTDTGAETQAAETKPTAENTSNEKNSSAQKNSATQKSDDGKDTPEDIMEKYIWTIRALEDEWARFTNSDDYKDLPEHTLDAQDAPKKIHRQIDEPNRKFLHAAAAYRKNMILIAN